MTDISNSADMIDVRDVIARFEELRDEVLCEGHDLAGDELEAAQEEMTTLKSLLSDLKGNGGDEQWEGDWYPVTLIRDDYFETAMDDIVADCYDLDAIKVPSFVTLTIDYDALRMDYTSCEFDGVTYRYR